MVMRETLLTQRREAILLKQIAEMDQEIRDLKAKTAGHNGISRAFQSLAEMVMPRFGSVPKRDAGVEQ